SVTGSMSVSLNAKQAKLFKLSPVFAPPSFISQPPSVTNTNPMYAGVRITFSTTLSGTAPFSYQWYQILNGTTNLIGGATNSTFTHLSHPSDTNGALSFFVVATNVYGSATSSPASLNITSVVGGVSAAVSVQ